MCVEKFGRSLKERGCRRVITLPSDTRRSALLRAAGCRVELAPSECCGRPMINNGLLRALPPKGAGRHWAIPGGLRWMPGATVRDVDSRCCSMVGSFGYETEHYETSLAMGERVLFKAIRDLPPDAVVVASGASCRQQIFHGTGRRGLHLVEVLAGALEDARCGDAGC